MVEGENFNRTCESMQALLDTNELPATFEAAAQWIRIWEDDLDHAVDEAAAWIDVGWTDAAVVADLVLLKLSPSEAIAKARAAGTTVAQLVASGGTFNGKSLRDLWK